MSHRKPFIIGITGGSGSGKTSFIRKLRSKFGMDQLCIISQDEYYKPRELQQSDDIGIKNFDLPYSIDHENFKIDLNRILKGETIFRQEYTFNNELKTSSHFEYIPAPILLIEGLFVFYDEEIRDLMDLKVFIHAKENLKVIRRIKRDQIERNYPLDDVLYRYENHVIPSYDSFIKPYMDEADLIINNNRTFDKGLNVISGFLQSYLVNEKVHGFMHVNDV
jgi:uridine kinase